MISDIFIYPFVNVYANYSLIQGSKFIRGGRLQHEVSYINVRGRSRKWRVCEYGGYITIDVKNEEVNIVVFVEEPTLESVPEISNSWMNIEKCNYNHTYISPIKISRFHLWFCEILIIPEKLTCLVFFVFSYHSASVIYPSAFVITEFQKCLVPTIQ